MLFLTLPASYPPSEVSSSLWPVASCRLPCCIHHLSQMPLTRHGSVSSLPSLPPQLTTFTDCLLLCVFSQTLINLSLSSFLGRRRLYWPRHGFHEASKPEERVPCQHSALVCVCGAEDSTGVLHWVGCNLPLRYRPSLVRWSFLESKMYSNVSTVFLF